MPAVASEPRGSARKRTLLGGSVAPEQRSTDAAVGRTLVVPSQGLELPGFVPEPMTEHARPAHYPKLSVKPTIQGVPVVAPPPPEGNVAERRAPPSIGDAWGARPPSMARQQRAAGARFGSGAERPGRLATLIWLVAAVLVVAATGVLVASTWSRQPSVSVSLTEGDGGSQRLVLSCASCPDGTVAELAGTRLTLNGGQATVPLQEQLPVGLHERQLAIERPGVLARRETLRVQIPVDFSVASDLSEIDEKVPTAALVFEAIPGTTIRVAGRSLRLDPRGRGRHLVDLTRTLSAEAPAELKLELRYVVHTVGGRKIEGSADVVAPIAPLELFAPGPRLITDEREVVVAGRAATGAEVRVGADLVRTGADGSFETTLILEQLGSHAIGVRADLPGHAPRLAAAIVDRVPDAEAAGAQFRQTAVDSYGHIRRNPGAHAGQAVAFEAQVSEIATTEHTTTLVVLVRSGCQLPRCPARVEHGRPLRLRPGSEVSIFGRLAGTFQGQEEGKAIPLVAAALVLPSADRPR